MEMPSGYHVIIGTDRADVITEVKQYLEEGWRLAGGISVTHAGPDEQGRTVYLYAQAISQR